MSQAADPRSDPSGRHPLPSAAQDGAVRRRDPERTRSALLGAALVEFAEKGLAGARVDEIAARAGVNKQMISYHFGGKEGLYAALREGWQLHDRAIDDLSRPLADVVVGYLDEVYADPDRVRFSVREAIESDPTTVAHDPDAPDLGNLRSRRDAGEVTGDLEPGFVLMVLQSIVMSGSVFPGETKRLLGLDPGSPEYLELMHDQLRRLVQKLA